MKTLRFSFAAEQRLDEIFEWSYTQFGMKTVLDYQENLIEICQRIAAGTAQTQSCKAIVSADINTDLRFARARRHFIVFQEMEEIIGIVDLLHSSSDLATILESLGKWEN